MRISTEMFTNPHGGRISGSDATCLQSPFEGKTPAKPAVFVTRYPIAPPSIVFIHTVSAGGRIIPAGARCTIRRTTAIRVPNLRHDCSGCS